MKVYTIFDDFPRDAIELLESSGASVTVHPKGMERPNRDQMKSILEEYDGVIIGTTQKIDEDMFERIDTPKIISTASVGVDHVKIPKEKLNLITFKNTPGVNAISVAEYTFGAALNCCRRISEGVTLYRNGQNNKKLRKKPRELNGKTIGVIGAGNVAKNIITLANMFEMNVICWTSHPERHKDMIEKNVKFVLLEEIAKQSDVVSVNIPDVEETKGIISRKFIETMKEDAIFISVSRMPAVDMKALVEKVDLYPDFYACLDVDVDKNIVKELTSYKNVYVTPHIAGGTVEARNRMFYKAAENIVEYIIEA